MNVVAATPTVKPENVAGEVKMGGVGVGDGVNELLTPAALVPPGPVAVTEQV